MIVFKIDRPELEAAVRIRNERAGYPTNDKHPITCIAREDATAYAKWLAESHVLREHRRAGSG